MLTTLIRAYSAYIKTAFWAMVMAVGLSVFYGGVRTTALWISILWFVALIGLIGLTSLASRVTLTGRSQDRGRPDIRHSARKEKRRVFTGIDIGTNKIAAVIAQVENDTMLVLGSATVPAKGIKHGIVVDLSETVESLKHCLDIAERQAKTVVESAYVSIGDPNTRGRNTTGQIKVRQRNGEITVEEVERVVSVAREMDVPDGYEVIHVLTQGFSVDGNEVVNPIGMYSQELRVKLHVVLVSSVVLQALVSAVNKAGVVVDGIVMQQLSAAESILSEDEKELGTLVADIGGETVAITVYGEGSIWLSQVLPTGGNLITRDIAVGLNIPLEVAEDLKKSVGSVSPERVSSEEIIEITESVLGRRKAVARELVCKIIEARCDEMLGEVAEIIRQVDRKRELITVVLTGGGAMLDGLADRAEAVLKKPVRLGFPVTTVSPEDSMFHPAYSSLLGLLDYQIKIREVIPVRVAAEKTWAWTLSRSPNRLIPFPSSRKPFSHEAVEGRR